jgi:hypothetical protein
MSLHNDFNQQQVSKSINQVKDVGDLIGSRKVLELLKQAVKESIASTAYIVSRMYLYTVIIHCLKYFDYWITRSSRYGINVNVMKEIVPFEDSFEVRIRVDIRDIDVKKLKKNWRLISTAIKKTDDDSVKLVMKIGQPIFVETWKEFDEDYMQSNVDGLKEFKVVKEEQINEGENS